VLGAVQADRTPPLTGPYTERDPFHDPFGSHVTVVTMGRGLDYVDGHIDYLVSVAEALSLK
jgi:hypothetical protein